MNTSKVHCDCLNYCGDDPWLKDGRADYCEQWLKRHNIEQERLRARERVDKLVTRCMYDIGKGESATLNKEEVEELFRYFTR
jgi:hypothetical protein